jgi:ActR/RegA family two-component response regulator
MSNESVDSLLLIVDSETKASRLIKALEPDGYQFEVIHSLEDTLSSIRAGSPLWRSCGFLILPPMRLKI